MIKKAKLLIPAVIIMTALFPVYLSAEETGDSFIYLTPCAGISGGVTITDPVNLSFGATALAQVDFELLDGFTLGACGGVYTSDLFSNLGSSPFWLPQGALCFNFRLSDSFWLGFDLGFMTAVNLIFDAHQIKFGAFPFLSLGNFPFAITYGYRFEL